MIQTQQGKLSQAINSLQRAIALRPADAAAHNLSGNSLFTAGRVDDAIAAYRKTIELSPSHHVAHDNLLLALNHRAGDGGAMMLAEHREWAREHASAEQDVGQIEHLRCSANNEMLRIGYLSGDFRRHAVACFFEPLLAAHDRSRFEITLYANVDVEDDVSQRLKSAGTSWVNVVAMDDDSLCRRIRADRIDILIDLAGHTSGNRLRAMARRCAPVQASYLGYPATTGMSAIDYVITDVDLDPPTDASDAWHTEKLLRLPRTMHCYRPPDDAPGVETVVADRPVSFGSFNRLEKMTDKTVELWSRVLESVSDATLTIKTAALADADVRGFVLDRFSRRNIDPVRLILLGRDASEAEHLRKYGKIDVALDSYPYNGTTTTCEALWMGVPVVTREGPTRVTRTTGGILRAIGLVELCAADDDAFVAIAAGLAVDAGRRRELRRGMRDRMQRSPLMDAKSLAAEIEYLYRRVWREVAAGKNGGGKPG
jgi:predicted O-linked N-acetylglucosamine transferase (SPINDLY family)